MDYTIIHPGGLLDTYNKRYQQQQPRVILDVDDNLFLNKQHNQTSISRDDVAELCVSALNVGRGTKVSFDCIAVTTTNYNDDGGDGKYDDDDKSISKTSDETLLKFLEESKTANYSLA